MKGKRLLLIQCILVPLLVGVVASLITRGGTVQYESFVKPPLSPPAWLFPIVWTILYILMGISSYLILTSNASKEQKDGAMMLYWYQLAVNFLWPTFFFNFEWYFFSLLWLLLLWVLVLLMILAFYKIDKRAAWLNVPYLIWLTFAAYLNAMVWWLN